MTIKETITDCAQKIGLELLPNGDINMDNINSIDFVSFFVEIENQFSIEIPDDFLKIENLSSVNYLGEMVKSLLETQKQKSDYNDNFNSK